MRKLLLILLLVLIVNTAGAQQLIKGKIVDKKSGEPVESAVISLKNESVITTTDKLGYFSIQSKNDSADVIITCVGYSPLSVKLGMNILVKMESASLNLKEIVIAAGVNKTQFATLSKIDLALRPAKSSQELLRYIPGLFIAQHQGGGKAEQIFLRGFDIDHGTDIRVTVDGVPVNMVSHAHGQGYADLHFLIPELVKNIDYGTGPYYTQQGDFNTAGYAAFETVNKLSSNHIQLEAGMFNTFRTLAMLNLSNHNSSRTSAYVATELLYSDGPFISAQHFNRFNLFSKYNYELNKRNLLTVTGSIFNSKWKGSGQIPERAVESGMISRFGAINDKEGGYTGRINISAKLNSDLRNGDVLENQLYYSRYHLNLFSDFTFFLDDPVNGDEIKQKEMRDIFGYNGSYQSRLFTKWAKFNTTAGAGFRYDFVNNSELSHTLNRMDILERITLGDISECNVNLFADEKIEAGKWILDAGVRLDHFYFNYADQLVSSYPARSKTILSPKLNIQYNFNRNFQLYIKTGKGFHSNDTRVVVANSGKEILPAAYGSDLGLIWKPAPGMLVNFAIWYLQMEQEFVYAGDEGRVEPSGRTRREGIDLAVRYQFSKTWFADMNINLAKARYTDELKTENYIPLAPSFSSIGGINYNGKNGWKGSIRYRYIKDRPANEDYSITAKGYLVTDANIGYSTGKLEMGLIAENIFNVKWNEAQFATTSRLRNETTAVTELHFTPGNPFFLKARLAVNF